MELGRCVATIAWINPRRLARDEAKTFPIVETNLARSQYVELDVYHINLPSSGHDTAEFAFRKVKLLFHVVVDQRKGDHTTPKGIEEKQAAELEQNRTARL
jgi:hypothetical protein